MCVWAAASAGFSLPVPARVVMLLLVYYADVIITRREK